MAAGVTVRDLDEDLRRPGLGGEPLAHPYAGSVHLDAADARVGPREVDVLEDAERVPPRRHGLRCVQPVRVDPDDLARPDVADDLCADQVERTGLGRHHPVVADLPERQRSEPARVAKRDERVLDERRHGVGALKPAHRVRNGVHEWRRVARHERSDELGVRAGGEPDAVRDELGAELLDVHEVAVVAERDRPGGSVMDQRLGVRPPFAPVVEYRV